MISPVVWLTAENRRHFPLGEIRDLLHLCDRILPNSPAESDQLAAEFELDPDKFSVVPNGVDHEFGEPADPRLFRRRFGVNRPVHVERGQRRAAKESVALARVAAEMNRDLVLLGNVRDHDYLHECLAAGGDHVRYLGHVRTKTRCCAVAYRACECSCCPACWKLPGWRRWRPRPKAPGS